MASAMYANGLAAIGRGEVVWKAAGGSTVRAALLLSAEVPDVDTDDYAADYAANRALSSSSPVADEALTLLNPTFDAANNKVIFGMSNTPLTFSAIDNGQTLRAVGIHKFVTNDADSPVICYCQFASDLPTNGSDVEVTFSGGDVFRLVYTNP
jgi:hypothetical protein